MADSKSNLVPFEVLGVGDTAPRFGMELSIYALDNPSTRLGIVPNRWDLQILDELQGAGGGSFTVSKNDPKVLEDPSLLEYQNVCKVGLDGKIVGAFLIQSKKASYVTSDEWSGEVWKVAGAGLRDWLKNAVLYPYRGLKRDSQASRVFSFASERGSWYKPADWKTPAVVQQYNMDPNSGPFGTAPAEWPDAPTANWIWGAANTATDPAPVGLNFFRHEFVVDDAVGTKSYSVFASARSEFDVYIDGQSVIESRETDGYAQTWRADFDLGPGEHVLAARVRADGTRPSAFLAAFFRVGDAATETEATLLNVTNTSTWKVNPYPDPSPGWTPGEIMLTLLAEADARDVRFPGFLTPTFTAELDSDGLPWERALDWSFDIGTEYFDIVEQLEELVCDVWIDPDTLELNMYVTRGVHRDVQSAAVQPVKFEIGRNVTKADEEGKSDIKNALVMNTNDGWSALADGTSGSREKYGRIEGYVSTGASDAVSGDVAQAVFLQRAKPEVTATYEIIDVDDARPHFDFFPGDWTLAPSAERDTALVPRRVMSIAVSEDNSTGEPQFAVEFDTIFQDSETRYDRWLRKTGDGTLGGTLANVSVGGGGGGSSSPTTQSTQRGPQGLEGPRGFPGFDYRGVWVPDTYEVSDVVFYNNKFWVTDKTTTQTPSSNSTDWTELTVVPSTPPASGITVYLTEDYTAPAAATAIPWSGERFKSGITHAANSTDIVISDAGPYFLSGVVQASMAGSGQFREYQMQVNGAVVAYARSAQATNSSVTVTATFAGVYLNLDVGDVVRIVSTASAAHTIPQGTSSWFSVAKVSGVQGPAGPTGAAGAINSATATGLSAGSAPTITLGGTPQARTMEFGIPAGAKGAKGDAGDAGKISSATATALAEGAAPSVTLGGTAQDRTMEFGIPVGAKGAKGDKGDPGAPLNFRGAWSSSTAYAPSDAVSYGGAVYVTAVANTNKTPGADPEWIAYSSGGSGSGVPAGGTTGQVLQKVSNTDGDATWKDLVLPVGVQEVIPSWIQSVTSYADSASSLAVPALAVKAGNTLLMVVMARAEITTPSGWTLLGTVGPDGADTTAQRLAYFTKAVTVSGNENLTVTAASPGRMQIAMVEFANVASVVLRSDLTFNGAEFSQVNHYLPSKGTNRAVLWAFSQLYPSGSAFTSDVFMQSPYWAASFRTALFYDALAPANRTITGTDASANYRQRTAVELTGTLAQSMSAALPARDVATVTTASIASAATSKMTIPLSKGYRLFKITTDKPARVRIYATVAQQTTDEPRAIGVDPIGNHGLLFEYVSTAGSLSAGLSPFVDGASMETSPSANIPISITNLSGSTGTVKVDLTYVRTE